MKALHSLVLFATLATGCGSPEALTLSEARHGGRSSSDDGANHDVGDDRGGDRNRSNDDSTGDRGGDRSRSTDDSTGDRGGDRSCSTDDSTGDRGGDRSRSTDDQSADRGSRGREQRIATPATQTIASGAAFSLQLERTRTRDDDVYVFSATGLPAGLAIDATSGLISGTVSAAAGTFNVVVSFVEANEPAGHRARTVSFAIVVTDAL